MAFGTCRPSHASQFLRLSLLPYVHTRCGFTDARRADARRASRAKERVGKAQVPSPAPAPLPRPVSLLPLRAEITEGTGVGKAQGGQAPSRPPRSTSGKKKGDPEEMSHAHCTTCRQRDSLGEACPGLPLCTPLQERAACSGLCTLPRRSCERHSARAEACQLSVRATRSVRTTWLCHQEVLSRVTKKTSPVDPELGTPMLVFS